MGDGLLIVCGHRAFSKQLLSIIAPVAAGSHSIANTGADARRKTGLTEYAVILIAGWLPDENYVELAFDLSHRGCGGILVVAENDDTDSAHEILDGTEVTLLSSPVNKEALLRILQLLMRVSIGGDIVDRAKLMLIRKKGWSESQAHRYIQKISMDKRLPKEVSAQLVLRALERESPTPPGE